MKDSKKCIECYERHLDGFKRYAELADTIVARRDEEEIETDRCLQVLLFLEYRQAAETSKL
jgi:hypothetical protein